jgi:hypothetical protein
VGLAQLVLVVELIHLCSNHKFDMYIAFTANYFSVEYDVPVDSETLLVTDFVNLKIKAGSIF